MSSTSEATLHPRHPLRMVSIALRIWLSFLILVMLWTAWVANGVLFEGWVRPLPFVYMALVALLWAMDVWNEYRVSICSALLGVGLAMRGAEILLFQDAYDIRTRMTAASVWVFIGVSVLVFGFMNLVAISRMTANSEVWGSK
jgi:hypothetical protein